MEKEIIKAIKDLTGSKKLVTYEELGREVSKICSKNNGDKWFSDRLDHYLQSEEDYQGSIYKNKIEYSISEQHIEEKDINNIPFIINFYKVYELDNTEKVLNIYYFI